MCGIIGIIGQQQVASELYFGMNMLQHRGQDAAGMLTFSNRFHSRKGKGLVTQVFDENSLKSFEGSLGVGHVRYATQGTTDWNEAQPFYINYPLGIGMVHNGNVVNFGKLKRRCREENLNVVETSNDLELLLYTFASFLMRDSQSQRITADAVFTAVEETVKLAEGAFATLAIIAGQGLLAFQDPAAIRPLLLGRRKGTTDFSYAFASESSALEVLGYDVIRELGPAEAVFINLDGEVFEKMLTKKPKERRFCVFEYIYFAREDSHFLGYGVSTMRKEMGRVLAEQFREKGLKPDVVIDVPSSAWFSASALAQELGVPYEKGFVKNKYVGRSFIMSSQMQRDAAVRLKLNPVTEAIAGKKVAVVDDSLVRGTTSQRIVSLLRKCGAKEIYFVSAAPPIKYPCVYGIDISNKQELLAARLSAEEIRDYIGADEMIYQTMDSMKKVFKKLSLCTACFSGEYPTTLTDNDFAELAAERITSKASIPQEFPGHY